MRFTVRLVNISCPALEKQLEARGYTGVGSLVVSGDAEHGFEEEHRDWMLWVVIACLVVYILVKRR